MIKKIGAKIGATCLILAVGVLVIAQSAPNEPWRSASLFNAIKAGRVDLLKAALDAGADVNAVSYDPYYGSLLAYATGSGRLDMVNLLLSRGADPKAKGNEDLLLRAIGCQGTALLKRLVEAGAPVREPKDMPLCDSLAAQAVFLGNSEALSYLIRHGADPNETRKTSGQTALELAAAQGNIEEIKMLLDAGADINHRDWNGMSALMQACCHGKASAAELLASRGAVSYFENASGLTAAACAERENGDHSTRLRVACAERHSAKLPTTGAEPWKDDELFGAVSVGNNDVVESALKKGKDPNTDHPSYGSLLNWAAHNGQLATLKLLLAHGADPRGKGNDRLLLEPIVQGRTDIVKCLVEAGARLTKPKALFFWWDYLGLAARDTNRDMVEYLLSKGANANGVYEPENLSPLEIASGGKDIEIVKLLLTAGADVNHRSYDGWSSLMCACYQGNLDVAKLLLAHGADPSFKDGYNRTAADLAEHSNSGNIAELRAICAGK